VDRLRPTEFVCNLATGADVLTGLAQPHTPRFLDGGWLVCNSATSELLRYGAAGILERRLPLRGFTRGIAATDDFLFVGESAPRRAPEGEQLASFAVLRRDTWEVLDRLELPVREVYDLVAVPSALAEGARRGFRTNATRVQAREQRDLFARAGIAPVSLWAAADPLPPEACRVRIPVALPTRLAAGTRVDITCEIENRAGAFYIPALPNPVQIGYKWLDPATWEWIEPTGWERTRLPRTLAPGERVACRVRIVAPQRAGQLRLVVTLVQEYVRWFDEVGEENAVTGMVEITLTVG
jgi:hypothetical protein